MPNELGHETVVRCDCGTRPARLATEQAKCRLRGHSYRALRYLSCELTGDVLILRGHVPSYYLKQVAQEAVLEVAGDVQVVNEIEVAVPTLAGSA
jgi:hypothetical protein